MEHLKKSTEKFPQSKPKLTQKEIEKLSKDRQNNKIVLK